MTVASVPLNAERGRSTFGDWIERRAMLLMVLSSILAIFLLLNWIGLERLDQAVFGALAIFKSRQWGVGLSLFLIVAVLAILALYYTFCHRVVQKLAADIQRASHQGPEALSKVLWASDLAENYTAFLNARSNQDPVEARAVDAVAFFAPDELPFKYVKILATIGNAALTLGLLLTFCGLAAALAETTALGVASGGMDAMQTMVTDILKVSATKFLTSIAGLLCYTIIMVTHRIWSFSFDKAARKIGEAVANVYKTQRPEDVLLQIAQIGGNTETLLKGLADTLSIKLTESLDRLLAQVTQDFGRSVSTAFNQATLQQTSSLQQLRASQAAETDRLVETIRSRTTNDLAGVAGTLIDQVTQGAGEALRALPPTLEALNASLQQTGDTMVRSIDASAARLAGVFALAATEIQTQLSQAGNALEAQIAASGTQLQDILATMPGQLEALSRQMQAALGQSATVLEGSAAAMQTSMQNGAGAFDTALARSSAQMEQGLAAALERMQGGLAGAGEDLQGRLQQAVGQLETALSVTVPAQLQERLGSFREMLDAMPAQLQAVSAEMQAAVLQASAQLGQSATALQTAMTTGGAALTQVLAGAAIQVGEASTAAADRLREATAGMEQVTTSLQTLPAALQDAQAGLLPQLTAARDAMAVLQATTATVNTTLTAVQGTQTAMTQTAEAARTDFETYKRSFAEAERNLGGLITSLIDRLRELQNFVNGLDHAMAQAVTYLREAVDELGETTRSIGGAVRPPSPPAAP